MAQEEDYKLDEHVTERDLLFRIARELQQLRRLNSEMVKFMRDAESEIPESLRRFANYFHDMHDVKFMYEEHGQPPPKYVLDELERLDDRCRQILKAHNTDGGVIERIRREMAADPDNRYDQTKQLTFKHSGEQQ